MTALRGPYQSTAALVYRAYEARERGELPDSADDGENAPAGGTPMRYHMGASLIGHACARYVWMAFHWVAAEQFDGRMLRLLREGHRIEAQVAEDLRAAGLEVTTVDPRTGRQIEVRALGGHFGGSLDGMAFRVPEAPTRYHVFECKSHSNGSFQDLEKLRVMAAKPQHYAQMQIYMGLTGVHDALYVANNKNTSHLYTERVAFDAAIFERLMERARAIIEAPEPPPRAAATALLKPCDSCGIKAICHGSAVPRVNCRTCAHSTPTLSGDAVWMCARHGGAIPPNFQARGCDAHRFLPVLLETWATPENGDDTDNWMRYRLRSGAGLFINGSQASGGFSSQEIAACEQNREMLVDPTVRAIRDTFDGARITDTMVEDEHGEKGAI